MNFAKGAIASLPPLPPHPYPTSVCDANASFTVSLNLASKVALKLLGHDKRSNKKVQTEISPFSAGRVHDCHPKQNLR